jgi:hypothetical protein
MAHGLLIQQTIEVKWLAQGHKFGDQRLVSNPQVWHHNQQTMLLLEFKTVKQEIWDIQELVTVKNKIYKFLCTFWFEFTWRE